MGEWMHGGASAVSDPSCGKNTLLQRVLLTRPDPGSHTLALYVRRTPLMKTTTQVARMGSIRVIRS